MATTAAGGSVTALDSNAPPEAVFRTTPTANASDEISGSMPFVVTFNMCASRDPDPGDALKFTYDFDGDGTADERGSCRTDHVYETEPTKQATVCVSDRQPIDGHTICKSYWILDGGPRPQVNTQTVIGRLTTSASPTPGGDEQIWSFEGQAGTVLRIQMDTISPLTAFDAISWISASPDPYDYYDFDSGDDDVPCTYPPPNFSCPDYTTTLPDTGTFYIQAEEYSGNAVSPLGEYRLTVTVLSGSKISHLQLEGYAVGPDSVEAVRLGTSRPKGTPGPAGGRGTTPPQGR